MGKLIAVQGCLIQSKTAGVTVANFQITTPPVTTVLADDKPVYAGTLSVIASGVTMGGFTCPTATFTILPSTAFATTNNQFLVVQGDSGLCTCTGTNPQGATSAITFTAEIVQAGQTGVELDVSEGGDLSLVHEQIQLLNTTITKLKSDLDLTNSKLTNAKAEIAKNKTDITSAQSEIATQKEGLRTVNTELGNRITDESTARTNADKNLQTQINERRLPAGSFIWYTGKTAPTGYLVCNGQAISRTIYSALFNAIGTIYGDGDGSTTFNVPNMMDGNGRFIRATTNPSNTKQDDAIRPIKGYLSRIYAETFNVGVYGGAFYPLGEDGEIKKTGAAWEKHPKFGFDANINSNNYGNAMAGHANGTDIHPYNISFLPLIAY